MRGISAKRQSLLKINKSTEKTPVFLASVLLYGFGLRAGGYRAGSQQVDYYDRADPERDPDYFAEREFFFEHDRAYKRCDGYRYACGHGKKNNGRNSFRKHRNEQIERKHRKCEQRAVKVQNFLESRMRIGVFVARNDRFVRGPGQQIGRAHV